MKLDTLILGGMLTSADLGRDADQHVHVVGHQVPLYDLDALPLAQLPEDLPQVLAVLVVDDLPSILWCEHDVVLAEPLRVREAVGLLGHGNHLPLGAGDLNNHHARGEGVLLRSNRCPPPAERVVFYAARTARHGLKPMNQQADTPSAPLTSLCLRIKSGIFSRGWSVRILHAVTASHITAADIILGALTISSYFMPRNWEKITR